MSWQTLFCGMWKEVCQFLLHCVHFNHSEMASLLTDLCGDWSAMNNLKQFLSLSFACKINMFFQCGNDSMHSINNCLHPAVHPGEPHGQLVNFCGEQQSGAFYSIFCGLFLLQDNCCQEGASCYRSHTCLWLLIHQKIDHTSNLCLQHVMWKAVSSCSCLIQL